MAYVYIIYTLMVTCSCRLKYGGNWCSDTCAGRWGQAPHWVKREKKIVVGEKKKSSEAIREVFCAGLASLADIFPI